MEIKTDRLLIRYFRESDLNQYCQLVADSDVMRFLGGSQTKEEAGAYLEEMIGLHSSSGLGRYIVELRNTQTMVGICGFRPADLYVDFGYRYAKKFWRQGIGLEAGLAVRQYGLECLNLHNMEAIVATDNTGSVRVLDHMGFKYRENIEYEGADSLRFRDSIERDLS